MDYNTGRGAALEIGCWNMVNVNIYIYIYIYIASSIRLTQWMPPRVTEGSESKNYNTGGEAWLRYKIIGRVTWLVNPFGLVSILLGQ